MLVYLDLNIFDKIEKKENLVDNEKEIYKNIEELILNKKVTVPYSNAHLNDLFRGFQKNRNYIDGHLSIIQRLTNNLCICQYWGQNTTTWHYRNIYDFFAHKKDEWEFEPSSFLEMFSDNDLDMPNPLELYKLIPLPPAFKEGYKDPMFALMYPKSRIQNNQLALMEDIYDFQSRLKSDYSLYKSFKTI